MRKLINLARNFLWWLRHPWVRHGRDFHCQFSTLFRVPTRRIRFGDSVGIGNRCLFLAEADVGNKVLIASHVAFVNSDDHNIHIVGKAIADSGKGLAHRILVEDDVWIGHGAILIAPCRIGRGSVVAAGSVVVSDVPRYTIVGGVPARQLKTRFTAAEIREHERILEERGELAPGDSTAVESLDGVAGLGKSD